MEQRSAIGERDSLERLRRTLSLHIVRHHHERMDGGYRTGCEGRIFPWCRGSSPWRMPDNAPAWSSRP